MTVPDRSRRSSEVRARTAMAGVLVVVLVTMAACGSSGRNDQSATGPDGSAPSASVPGDTAPDDTGPAPTLPPIAPPTPGPATVLSRVSKASSMVALTFDDGYCGECIGRMVDDLERTGAHVTFCPNGSYGKEWAPHVDRIKALIAKGQLQICNHTWDHKKITSLSPAALTAEIQHNEQWIESSFGVTGRPYFRPPYGAHNASTDQVAGSLGYTKVIVWSSSLIDSALQSPDFILQNLQTNLVPGGIVLGHLNYPPTGQVFDQMLAILAQRGLTPVTVAELVAAGP